jgi:hypothetical protein
MRVRRRVILLAAREFFFRWASNVSSPGFAVTDETEKARSTGRDQSNFLPAAASRTTRPAAQTSVFRGRLIGPIFRLSRERDLPISSETDDGWRQKY